MTRAWNLMAAAALLSLAGLSVGCQNKMYKENTDLREQNRALQRELDTKPATVNHDPMPPQQPVAQQYAAPVITTAPTAPQPIVDKMPSSPKQPDLGGFDVTRDPVAQTTTVNLPSDVFFSPGQATLQPEAKKSLGKVVSALKKEYAGKQVRIDGHTDSDPITKSHWKSNQELSEKRAEAVKDYLVSKGVEADRITTKGYGDTMPKSKTSKQVNRRVELVVLQTK